MAISPVGMANMCYYCCLPMGISSYGGDIQVYNVGEYTQPFFTTFNPMAQAEFLGGGGGGGITVPQLNLNIDVDALADAMWAPVIENLALSNVNSNNQTIATLKTRLNSLTESEGVSDGDKTTITQLLKELEEQEKAMKDLEDESLTNDDIYAKSKEISKKITEISKKASKITVSSAASDSTNNYANESQGFSSFNYATNSISSAGSSGRAELSSSEYGPKFLEKVKQIAQRINCDYKDLLGVMNSESGINASAKNPNGSATGLIQFIESTARGLGTTTAQLRRMKPIKQLDYVEKYLAQNKSAAGFSSGHKLSAGELYALIFLPARASRQVLATRGETYYSANRGLDKNKDGKITKDELGNRVISKRVSDTSFYA